MSDNYHHGNLRQALIRAASDLVRTGHIDDFSLRGIARELGVSPAAAYHHFADKSSLLNAVIRETGLELNRRLVSATTPTPPAGDQAMALGLAYIDFAIAEPALFTQMTSTACAEAEDIQAMSLELVKTAIANDARGAELSTEELQDRVWSSWAISHGFATLALAGRLTPEQARSAFIRQCHPDS